MVFAFRAWFIANSVEKKWTVKDTFKLSPKQRIHTSVNERINGVGQIHEESAQQLNIARYFSHKTCHDGNDPSRNPAYHERKYYDE